MPTRLAMSSLMKRWNVHWMTVNIIEHTLHGHATMRKSSHDDKFPTTKDFVHNKCSCTTAVKDDHSNSNDVVASAVMIARTPWQIDRNRSSNRHGLLIDIASQKYQSGPGPKLTL